MDKPKPYRKYGVIDWQGNLHLKFASAVSARRFADSLNKEKGDRTFCQVKLLKGEEEYALLQNTPVNGKLGL